ncbi:MAG TPA: hypothetical protein EYP77_02770, partial [Anaerolineae bacterium]|nr:hypothetical protein [Anaerolineae bacterium]
SSHASPTHLLAYLPTCPLAHLPTCPLAHSPTPPTPRDLRPLPFATAPPSSGRTGQSPAGRGRVVRRPARRTGGSG